MGYPSFKAFPTLRPENTAYFLPTLLLNMLARARTQSAWAETRSREPRLAGVGPLKGRENTWLVLRGRPLSHG